MGSQSAFGLTQFYFGDPHYAVMHVWTSFGGLFNSHGDDLINGSIACCVTMACMQLSSDDSWPYMDMDGLNHVGMF